MKRKIKKGKGVRHKAKLGLPDLENAKSTVLVSLRSPESQRSYRHSINEFVAWYCSAPRLSFNKTVVTRYRIYLEDRQLTPGTINVSPDLAAGIRRVKGSKKLGYRLGNWLTAVEARKLWQLPDPRTLKGKRDRAILGLLLGCGLGTRTPRAGGGRCAANLGTRSGGSPRVEGDARGTRKTGRSELKESKEKLWRRGWDSNPR
jgi:hypothetical protein